MLNLITYKLFYLVFHLHSFPTRRSSDLWPFIVLPVGVRSRSVGAGTRLLGAGPIRAGILLAGAGRRPIGRLVADRLPADRVPGARLTAGPRPLRPRRLVQPPMLGTACVIAPSMR